MSSDSKIEWTGDTHQFVSGCEDASPGCAFCYAKRQAHRMGSNPNPKVQQRYRGLTVLRGNGPQWTGEVRPLPEQLGVPLSQKRPRTIFVNSLSDTFHADIPDEYIAAMFGVMAATPRHTYQVLTKRAERMYRWFGKIGTGEMETAYGVLASDSPELEECLTAAWARDAFGELPRGISDTHVIKAADETLLMTEKRDLMAPAPAPWGHAQGVPAKPLDEVIRPWFHEQAEEAFLATFARWGGGR